MRDVVVIEAVRSPIGRHGRALSTIDATHRLRERTDGEHALVTMCRPGAMGTGTILPRL
jgi:acetyl-CoA acetyltransferase